MSALVIDEIGLLVTGEPSLGEGPLGLVRDAAVVIEGDRVAAIERAGAAGDERIDAGGRCVIPGFVEGHGHFTGVGLAVRNIVSMLGCEMNYGLHPITCGTELIQISYVAHPCGYCRMLSDYFVKRNHLMSVSH